MTSPARAIALGLVLCCLVTWTPSETWNEGTCPKAVVTCREPEPSTCNRTNNNCTGKQKCCSTRCYKECYNKIDPDVMLEKTGVCPYFDATECKDHSYMTKKCFTDGDCPGSCRCCCFNCFFQCMTTVRVRPGQCPANIMMECQFNSSTCKIDDDCLEGLKCCECCGKNCVKPIKEHPGVCPVSNERISCKITLVKPNCSNDANCNKEQKCCLSGNQMQCVTALKEKKGRCPDQDYRCTSTVQGKRCSVDNECAGPQKCCGEKSLKQCKYPEGYLIKLPRMDSYQLVTYQEPYIPGECLLPEETVGDHPVAKKCCDYNCVFKCVDV